MAVTIEIMETTATIKNLKWTCEFETLERVLNNLIDPIHWQQGYTPDPDYTCAEYVVKTFGGKIIKAIRQRIKEGLIY
jgi:hypothetical protein